MRRDQSPDAELPGYISKNIITRSLGPNAAVQVDLEGPHPVQAGDTFLLCSDGLSGQVKDDEIGMVLSCLPPAEAAQALVDLANLRGGPDNITVVIVRVLGPQIAQDTSSDSSGQGRIGKCRPGPSGGVDDHGRGGPGGRGNAGPGASLGGIGGISRRRRGAGCGPGAALRRGRPPLAKSSTGVSDAALT